MTDTLPINNSVTPQLNEAQRTAVDYDGGHLLIVAGPGTGKTHTLTHRIRRCLDDMDPGQHILAITFTKKAAQEMRDRLQEADAGERLNVGTFHQFGLEVLKQYSVELADIDVADPEQIDLRLAQECPDLSARDRKHWIQRVTRFKSDFEISDIPTEILQYNKILREAGWMDFDDVLIETVRLLREDQSVRQALQARYRAVFVDEYQDVNAVQRELLRLLIGPDNRLTAIGDPNQAIYGFRGSSVTYFYAFSKDFPGAVTMNLSENYRSAANILSASTQVIASRSDPAIQGLTAHILKHGRLFIEQSATPKAEAEYVVHQIEKLIGGTSMYSSDTGRVGYDDDALISFGDIAVLFRLNYQRHALIQAFDRMGIPYHVPMKIGAADDDLPGPLGDVEKEYQHERVTLMSLHASKGLEFPAVFIVGCEQRLIPLDIEGLSSDPDDERRLFYVGMTRAKQWLYLSHCARRSLFGRSYDPLPSPYLSDIEDRLKEYHERRQAHSRRKKNEKQIELF